MFLGQFEHSLDNKGRLTIPSKFRPELEDGLVVTRGLDNCLWIFARADWDVLAPKVAQLPTTNPAARNFSRFIFSQASDSAPDKQGRVLIPQQLRDFAGIDTDTVVIGTYSRIEIWSPERGNAIQEQVESNPEAYALQLQDLGI